MFSRAYKTAITLPPVLWVAAFLLLPYGLLLAHSFWALESGEIARHWNLDNYRELLRTPVYAEDRKSVV